MNIPLRTPIRLAAESDARSWIRKELLVACSGVATTHEVSGTFTLTEDECVTLHFAARLTSDLADLPVTAQYALPALSSGFESDRIHTIAEAIAELALTAADDHDFEQGELIRLIGLKDAVWLSDIAMLDIV